MLKDISTKKKSNILLIGSTFVSEQSNFKSGAISVSNKSKFFQAVSKLNEIAVIPEPGEEYRIVTRHNINTFDFILSVLDKERIQELIIAFYRIGKKAAIELSELQKKGLIGKITLLINDGFPKLVPDAWNAIKSMENESFQIKLENNHTKIILMDTGGGKYVVEGSGNLSNNARIEQYAFSNNEALYDFHKTWIDRI